MNEKKTMETKTISFQPEWQYPESVSTLRFGSRGAAFLTILITLITAVGAGLIVVVTNGSFMAGTAYLAAIIILFSSIYRLEWGFYIFMGMVLVFDQFPIPGFMPWTTKVYYFKNLKESPFFPNLGAAVVNPLELQLFLLFIIWFVVLAAQRNRRANKIQVWPVALLFFMGIVFSLLYGLKNGGEFLPALWEVRAIFYMGLLYIFVPQIIQTKKQVHTLFWVIILAISYKAFQGALRFTVFGFSTGGYETLTNHEDPVFILDVLIFLFALVLFQARSNQVYAIILMLLPMVLGFFAGERRAAYAAIVPTFAGLITILPGDVQKKVFKTSAWVLLFLALYFAAFWNSSSKLGSPVRLVKSGLSNDRESAGERYYSNLYREYEKYDLAQNVQINPVVGLGFGRKYEMPIPLIHIDFTLRDYIPHNEILWLLVKTGGIGFCLFCFFLNSIGFQGSAIVTKLKDPYLKSVGALAICAIINQLVVSNYDLQLTYYRNMVFLGTLLGLLSALQGMDGGDRKVNKSLIYN
ncbi:MAG: O-antigen ligase family protein [Bacteroidota bacterium]